MSLHATLNKNTSSLVSELTTYITANELDHDTLNEPFNPIINLGSASALIEHVPSLGTILSDSNLSFNNISVYTSYPRKIEFVSYLDVPYVIIPLQNFANQSLVLREPVTGATENVTPENWKYYHTEDTTEIERIQFDENTIYLVDAGVKHSFAHTDPTGYPWDPASCGMFLTATINEDLTSYFA